MKRAKSTIVILGLVWQAAEDGAAPTMTPYTVEVRILATTRLTRSCRIWCRVHSPGYAARRE